MKIIFKIIIIILAGYVLELFLPWWAIAIAAFLGGALIQTNANFIIGFVAVALLWLAKAWFVDFSAESDLPERVALIFPLHNKIFLFVFTAFVGGLIGGFATLTGSFLRKKKRAYR